MKGLRAAFDALKAEGVVAVWSSGPDSALDITGIGVTFSHAPIDDKLSPSTMIRRLDSMIRSLDSTIRSVTAMTQITERMTQLRGAMTHDP